MIVDGGEQTRERQQGTAHREVQARVRVPPAQVMQRGEEQDRVTERAGERHDDVLI
jgi:hypothetical protein